MDVILENRMLKEEISLLMDLNHVLEKQIRYYENKCPIQCYINKKQKKTKVFVTS